jgi:hypothetical protein
MFERRLAHMRTRWGSYFSIGMMLVTGCTQSGDDTADGEPEPPACMDSKLTAEPVAWPLPALGAAWADHVNDLYTNGVNYALVDLTGDALVDLVVASGAGQANIGTTAWLVYANTGNGFAAAPIEWPIPALGAAWADAPVDPFTDGVNYELIDVTGDHRPDMVIASGAGQPNVGTSAWLVYENTGVAFKADPISWTLPSLGAMWADTPTDLYTDGINYAVMDLHGDARPELVVASGTGQPNVGTTAWLVYENTGTGFSTTPASWALPALGSAWAELTYDRFTDGVNRALVDLQGDQLPELVVASGSDGASVGTTMWEVYANTGTGFATSPTPWALPSLGAQWADAVQDRFSDGINYGLYDLRGDRHPDLVIAMSPADPTVGSTKWLIHENIGSSFAADAATWVIPALGAGWATEVFDRASNGVNWGLVDLSGDPRPELVIAGGTSPTVGTTSWSVYGNVCPQ